jgi:hypothetical protein
MCIAAGAAFQRNPSDPHPLHRYRRPGQESPLRGGLRVLPVPPNATSSMPREFSLRTSVWISIAVLVPLLIPSAARARPRTWVSARGIITEAPMNGGPGTVIIESGSQILELKVTAATRVNRVGPPPEGPDGFEIKLEPGRYA